MKKLMPYLIFTIALNTLLITFYIDTLDMPKAAYQLPRLLIVLLSFLSLLMLGEQIWKLNKNPSAAAKTNAIDEVMEQQSDSQPLSPAEKRGRLVRIIGFIAALSAYILAIQPLGYFIATPLFLLGTLAFLKSTKLPWALTIAVGFTGFVYLLFVMFLNLPVPMGLLANT